MTPEAVTLVNLAIVTRGGAVKREAFGIAWTDINLAFKI